MKSKRRFVIYTPGYDDKVGGIMALYGLGHALRQIDAPVSIWQWNVEPKLGSWLKHRIRDLTTRFLGKKNKAQQAEERAWLEKPLANAALQDLNNAIVIYPEVVDGNPLNARRVARWFLNKPGFFTGRVNYGPGELYFFYDKVFDDPSINPHRDNHLPIVTVMGLYRQTNFGPRKGTCYILRKGKQRVPDPAILDGPVIDDLGHEEIVELFNRCEYCVSYDTYTMFSAYAAICGCKSVVVPEIGLSKEQWALGGEGESGHYGVAYGFNDLAYAERTKPLLLDKLIELEKKNLHFAAMFRDRCDAFFANEVDGKSLGQ